MLKYRIHTLLTIWFLIGCGWTIAAEPIPPTVRLLVPAYFYPADEGLQSWVKLIDAAAKVPVVAIVNPDSGPGKQADPNYSAIFERAKNTRITLIGYVTLSYAKRPVDSVQAEIDRWVAYYPDIRGIFFDEQPSGAEHVQFAAACFAYAKKKIDRAELISNPGTLCAPDYLNLRESPTVCVFENQRGFDEYRLPKWADALQPKRFAILHYNLKTVDDMQKLLQAAIQQRAGYLYLTDRQAPAPWTKLPSYWDEEVSAVMRINRLIDIPMQSTIKRQ